MEQLALYGGKPYKSKPFPVWPIADGREKELLLEVLYSRKWWRMSGSKVEEFESRFARLHNAKFCIGLTNGTHAIELALASMEIGAGDEVIIPAFTFISTATAVIYCNAKPILADVDPNTFCITAEAIERSITPKTKAIIAVHMAGHPCNMDEICKIAKKYNLKLIEDASHAHGGEWNGKKIGTFGDAATFSFQNGKLMTSGEGGCLITNHENLYEKAFLIHGVGRPKNDRVYRHVYLGSNYRMNEFQAAILIAQLERLENLNKLRERNAKLLDKLMSEIEGIIPQGTDERATLNPHYMYMFYYSPGFFGGMSRKEFVDCLIAEGIPAFIAYPVICDTEFFKNNNFRTHIREKIDASLFHIPNSRRIANDVVWLPHYTLLGDDEDIEQIAGAIKKIQRVSQRRLKV